MNRISWTVNLEQCGLKELWVYKFDHEPIADGEWHPLNSKTSGVYRIRDQWFQLISPKRDCPSETWDAIRPQLCNIAPLKSVKGSAEIVLSMNVGILAVSEWWACSPETATELTTAAINEAYQRLLADPKHWE